MGKKLYLIGAPDIDAIKIGISDNPDERLHTLQVGNPYSLRVLHTIEVADAALAENAIHRVLETHRLRGEWFAIGFQAVLDAIEVAFTLLEDSQDDGRGNLIPWLAPPGECESCDRRRAAGIEAMKRSRGRKALAEQERRRQEGSGG